MALKEPLTKWTWQNETRLATGPAQENSFLGGAASQLAKKTHQKAGLAGKKGHNGRKTQGRRFTCARGKDDGSSRRKRDLPRHSLDKKNWQGEAGRIRGEGVPAPLKCAVQNPSRKNYSEEARTQTEDPPLICQRRRKKTLEPRDPGGSWCLERRLPLTLIRRGRG